MTEWQLYAQKVEGDSWQGEKIDQAKMQKMSGMFSKAAPPRRIFFSIHIVNEEGTLIGSRQMSKYSRCTS